MEMCQFSMTALVSETFDENHLPQWTDRELDFKVGQIKPNLECNYKFSIDSTPNGIQLNAKSIGK